MKRSAVKEVGYVIQPPMAPVSTDIAIVSMEIGAIGVAV